MAISPLDVIGLRLEKLRPDYSLCGAMFALLGPKR
jgi:hypothetical protein